MLSIDLDDFRFVNDTLGHQAGDELIIRVARLLARRLRGSDVLARLGGNEFGVLLPRAGSSAAMRVADSLLSELRNEKVQIGERTLTASIGVAACGDGAGANGEDLLADAGIAMHDAKLRGGNGTVLHKHSEQTDTRERGRAAWTERIRTAVAEDRFALLAQPIVEIATGEPVQHELLLRMRDEHGDLVPPATFLYIAERLKLTGEIDTWVTDNAIRLLADPNQPLGASTLEINLSSASIVDPRFLANVQRTLTAHGVDPARLTFAISQATALARVTVAIEFRSQLSRIGCRFALDGFGAGPASFHYLKHVGFDMLKIDGDLVRNCVTSDTDQLLIAAIVNVASGLGQRTVATDVGDTETHAVLRELGVDYGQGYHFGPPAPLTLGFQTPNPPS